MDFNLDDVSEFTIISDGPVILMVPLSENVITIMYVYTPPKMRGQGLMRAKLNALLKRSDDEGFNLFLLLSPDDDTDADRLRAFYESLGFVSGDGSMASHMIRESSLTSQS